VTATSPLHVRFTLPAKYASTIGKGSLFEVLSADGPHEAHTAKAITVSPVVDPASGTIDVTAEVTGNTGSLKPGMMANIKLAGGK
jgi:multidrug efflux pump subunit AcrA (membrane-fusion protein)